MITYYERKIKLGRIEQLLHIKNLQILSKSDIFSISSFTHAQTEGAIVT